MDVNTQKILLIFAVIAALGLGSLIFQNHNDHSDCSNGVCRVKDEEVQTPSPKMENYPTPPNIDETSPEVIEKGRPEDYKLNTGLYFFFGGHYYHRHYFQLRDGRPYRCRPPHHHHHSRH